jgi:hypothetical protein
VQTIASGTQTICLNACGSGAAQAGMHANMQACVGMHAWELHGSSGDSTGGEGAVAGLELSPNEAHDLRTASHRTQG